MAAQKSGFTILELIIVIAIFGIIAIAVITSLNPIEQINRGRDSALLEFASQLFQSTDRMHATNKTAPWDQPYSAIPLDSQDGELVLNRIINAKELKPSVTESNSGLLPQVLLSTSEQYEKRAFCFQPKSRSFRMHDLTKYSASGEPVENLCPEGGCYLCISTEQDLPEEEPEIISLADMTEEELCQDFDPEYPYYAGTTNFTEMNHDFGCTGYATYSDGCNTTDCPAGQRALRKVYSGNYAVDPAGWTQCLLARQDLQEIFCVPEPYAQCQIRPNGGFNLSDYEWGCTNPRRPMRWLPELMN